jgi:hypothetical protein
MSYTSIKVKWRNDELMREVRLKSFKVLHRLRCTTVCTVNVTLKLIIRTMGSGASTAGIGY